MDILLQIIPQYGSFSADCVARKFVNTNSDTKRRLQAMLQKFYKKYDFSKFNEISFDKKQDQLLPNDIKQELQRFVSNIALNDNEDNCEFSLDSLKEIEKELSTLAQSLNVENPDDMLIDNILEKPKEIELLLLSLREYFLIKYLIASLHNNSLKEVLPINSEFSEEVQTLSNGSVALISIVESQNYQLYRNIWIKLNESFQNTELAKTIIKYLNGGYRLFSSTQRLLTNSLTQLQIESLSSYGNLMVSLKNNDDISSINAYEGPSVLNTICDLLLSDDGNFRAVPLCDLDMWRNSLESLNQMIWTNTLLMTPTYCSLENNYKSSVVKAKRLIMEVNFIQEISEGREETNVTNYMEGFRKLFTQLKEQVTLIEPNNAIELHVSVKKQRKLFEVSILNTLMGSIELCLLTCTPLIDPVEKSRLKNNYLLEDIQCLNTMTVAYEFLRIPMKYKHLGEEIYDSLLLNKQKLMEKQSKYEEKVALRPDKCLYINLVKDLTHFLNTNCDPHLLNNIVEDVKSTWIKLTTSKDNLNKTLENCGEILNKLDLWIANSQRFIHHTMKPYYAYYQDFIQPIQCSIDQLRFGFEGLKKVLIQVSKSMVSNKNDSTHISNINENGKLHTVIQNIMEFPSNKTLSIYNVSSSKDILQNRCPIFSVLDKVQGGEKDYFRLLKAKLVELKNRANISHLMNEELYKEFDFAFNIINQIWQQEEERRKLKKKEDDSLYATKTKCHDEDEELKELEEIEEMFPTGLQEDFGEFVQEDTLEKVMKLDKTKTTKLKDVNSPIVKDEDYAFIAQTFNEILIKYTQAYYHPRAKTNDKLEFIDYFRNRLAVFVRLYNSYKSSINEYLDEECFNSLCFSVSLQQDLLNESTMNKLPKDENLYNFYKDSNIAEILSCTDVLKSIEDRVDEELTLYSEHATLLDIKRIIGRIRLLPSTASVVRFNTGFQLLRHKVAQWNEVAHKNNHLKTQEQEIAEYVQKWTRLELQFWRNCMSQTQEKVEKSAYKYWFFIYNLFHEYFKYNEIDATLTDIKYTEKRFEDLETLDQDITNSAKAKVALKDIIYILRQFVESSCYGDFLVRLQLLHSFELYLHNSLNFSEDESSNQHKLELIYGLRNLQLYFAQFSKEIVEHNKSMRTPIEKKLKELVKIESYNKDLSYFSMRNNVARVHRNLNKFLKEYEQLLKQKITSVFQPKDATTKDYSLANDKGKDLRQDSTIKYCRVDAKYYMVPQKLKAVPTTGDAAASKENPQSLLCKVQKLFNTSRNVVKETVTNASYPKLAIALDSLLTEQLERCEHLRNLTVDRSKERPKQVLEAKSILQQKRKGLTDLFKILSTLGLNYKTGLLEMSLRSEFENFTLPPFCIKSMLSHLGGKRQQPQILQLNENVDLYFHKCVFKLKLLQNIMLTPLSELGPHNIERIKGFAVDLFLLVQNQRQLLSNTAKNIYDLHVVLQQLKELGSLTSHQESIDESYVNFNQFRDRYNVLKSTFIRIRYVFEQFTLFLQCAPKKQRPENCLFPESANSPSLVQNSELYHNITNLSANILKLSKTTIKEMLDHNTEFLNKSKLDEYYESYTQLKDLTSKLVDCFEASCNEYVPIAKPLLDLTAYMNEVTDLLARQQIVDDTKATIVESYENIEPELENIIHSILMSLQKLYKKYPSKSQNEDDGGSPKKKESDSDEDIQEQHLKKRVYEELKDDWHIMNVDHINEKLSNILIALKLSQPSGEKIQLIRQLLTIQPLLEQFNLMAEYYLLQQLGSHKISVKILLIILTVFVEIGSKGFCVPQDLMQDEEGEKKKDQKEGEGFGLEDGTGEKDASDKIESEDQLEDAKRPEDRKEDEDKNEQEECKEEKGIEMSDDFEGKSEKLDKPEEDDSGESEEEEELNKEMGETEEGADKLDDQIWGDDEEEQEDEEKDLEEEEDGKGSKDEKDAHNDLNSKDEQAKDNDKNNEEESGLDSTTDPKEDKRKQQEKDIDDMKDQGEDDQVNPYHNELEEPPEPEDFDLGDVNMDDKEENEDDQKCDDNPFDIDTMKENMPEPDETQEDDKEGEDGEGQDDNQNNEESDGSESEDGGEDQSLLKEDKAAENNEEEEEEKEDGEDKDEPEQQKRGEMEEETRNEEQDDNKEEIQEEKPEDYEQSKDKSSKEENIQSNPDSETDGTKDQLQSEQTENDIQQEQSMDEQDTGEEKDGVGQAENDVSLSKFS